MSDRYQNFAELKAGCRAGRDYNIRMEDRGGRVLVFSPHAGGIEPGTSELVRAIAGADLSYYLFEGIRSGNNSELHITSHHFDEPRCVGLIEKFEISLALHGYNKFEPMIYLGGKNERLKEKLKEILKQKLKIFQRSSKASFWKIPAAPFAGRSTRKQRSSVPAGNSSVP